MVRFAWRGEIDQRITFADSIARYNYVWKGTTRRSYFSIAFENLSSL